MSVVVILVLFQHAKKIQSKLYPNDFVIHIQNHSGSIRTHSEENGTHGWERGDRKKPKRAESCSKESRPELLRGQCQCISSLCKVHSSDWRSGQPSPITTRQTAMFPLLLPDSRCRGGGGANSSNIDNKGIFIHARFQHPDL